MRLTAREIITALTVIGFAVGLIWYNKTVAKPQPAPTVIDDSSLLPF